MGSPSTTDTGGSRGIKSHSIRLDKLFSLLYLHVRESKYWPRFHKKIESPPGLVKANLYYLEDALVYGDCRATSDLRNLGWSFGKQLLAEAPDNPLAGDISLGI